MASHIIADGIEIYVDGKITKTETDYDWTTVIVGDQRITYKIELQLDYEHEEAKSEENARNQHMFKHFDIDSRDEVELYLPERYDVMVDKLNPDARVVLTFSHNDHDPEDNDWRKLYYTAPVDEYDSIIAWLEGLGYTRDEYWNKYTHFGVYEHLAEKRKWEQLPKLDKPDMFMTGSEQLNKAMFIPFKSLVESQKVKSFEEWYVDYTATDNKEADPQAEARQRSRDDLKQKRRESRRRNGKL